MSKRLKLTKADIELSNQQMPPVLTIRSEDLNGVQQVARANPLQITAADLSSAGAQSVSAPNLTELETLMYGLINKARQEHLPSWFGNPNLLWHDGLTAVAQAHASDMLKQPMGDYAPSNSLQVAQRIEKQGIRFIACGENIGVVHGPASHSTAGIHAVHDEFMNQPRRLTNHRGNLLNPIWTHVGVGIAYAPGNQTATGKLIVTQHFIATFR